MTDEKYTKKQKRVTNLFGLAMLIIVVVSLIIKVYLASIIVFVGGGIGYLFFKKFDRDDKFQQQNSQLKN